MKYPKCFLSPHRCKKTLCLEMFPKQTNKQKRAASLTLRCGTAGPASAPCPSGESCRAAGPGVWCTPASAPRAGGRDSWASRGDVFTSRACVCVWESSPRRESRSIRVCGWGSTGWRPAGSACCSSGRREPAGRQTGRRLRRPDAECSAAEVVTKKKTKR